MSEAGITVLDGTHLRSLHVSVPDEPTTGTQLLELAESTASNSLFNLSLPHSITSSALIRANISDDVTFRETHLAPDAAAVVARSYLTAIADELKEKPLMVSVLDGKTVRLVLEDEDDFAMVAENLFTDLDVEDRGKIKKREIRNALVNMGVEMGVPPFEEFPLLNGILKKHGAEGAEELGVSQFAELLQPILQEVADTLAAKHIAVILKIQIFNGSELRKLLADEKQLDDVMAKILQEKRNSKDGENNTEIIKSYLENNWKQLGLPPSETNEAVVLLYDTIFTEIESTKGAAEVEKEFMELLKEVLEKFAEQLEAIPVFCDLEN